MGSTLGIAAGVSLTGAAIYVSAQVLHHWYIRRRDWRHWETNRQAGNTPTLERIADESHQRQADPAAP